MRPGNKVAWSSTSRGVTKVKNGVVVETIPAGHYPDKEYFRKHFNTHPLKNCSRVGGRSTTSYVVAVANGNGKPLLYWPNAENLIRV